MRSTRIRSSSCCSSSSRFPSLLSKLFSCIIVVAIIAITARAKRKASPSPPSSFDGSIRILQNSNTSSDVVRMNLTVAVPSPLPTGQPTDGDFETWLCHLAAFFTQQLSLDVQLAHSQWTYQQGEATITTDVTASVKHSVIDVGVSTADLLPKLQTYASVDSITSSLQSTLPKNNFFQTASVTDVTHTVGPSSTGQDDYFNTTKTCGTAVVTMFFGFFSDIPIEKQMPSQYEVQNLMCQTDTYYSTLFTGQNQLLNGQGSALTVTIDRVTWEFQPDQNLTVVVTYDMAAASSQTGRRVAPMDVLLWLQASDLQSYVQYAVWLSVPKKQNVFYNVDRVHYKGTVRQLVQGTPKQTFSTKYCENGVIPSNDTSLVGANDGASMGGNNNSSSISDAITAAPVETQPPTYEVASYKLQFGFSKGTARAPDKTEVFEMVCQTAYYFTNLFLSPQAAVTPFAQRDFPISKFAIESHGWTYNATADLPVVIQFDAMAWYQRGNQVSATVVLHKMKSINIANFIQNYVWQVPPDHLFYNTETVHYVGTVKTRQGQPEDGSPPSNGNNNTDGNIMYSNSCPRFATEAPTQNPGTTAPQTGSGGGSSSSSSSTATAATLNPNPPKIIISPNFPGFGGTVPPSTGSSGPSTGPSSGGPSNIFNNGQNHNPNTNGSNNITSSTVFPNTIGNNTVGGGDLSSSSSPNNNNNSNSNTDTTTATNTGNSGSLLSGSSLLVLDAADVNVSFYVVDPTGNSSTADDLTVVKKAFEYFIENLKRSINDQSNHRRHRKLSGNTGSASWVPGSTQVDSLTLTNCSAITDNNTGTAKTGNVSSLQTTNATRCYYALAHYQLLVIGEAVDSYEKAYADITYEEIEKGLLQTSLETVSSDSKLMINPDWMARLPGSNSNPTMTFTHPNATSATENPQTTSSNEPGSVRPVAEGPPVNFSNIGISIPTFGKTQQNGNNDHAGSGKKKKNKQLSGGIIFLIVLVCLVFFLVCCVAPIYWFYFYGRSRSNTEGKDPRDCYEEDNKEDERLVSEESNGKTDSDGSEEAREHAQAADDNV